MRTSAERTSPGSTGAAEEILRRLVAFDTTSAKSNLELIAYVQDYLTAHGVECALVPAPDGQP